MAIFSRHRPRNPALPPGQHEEGGFPVLTAGVTPRIRPGAWRLTLTTERGERRQWDLAALTALGTERIETDLHCVTRWSRLGTAWTGVPVDRLLEGLETEAPFVLARSTGGYSTDLAIEDVTDGRAWIATALEGGPLPAEHGGPARLLVPHLYLWKSAKWIESLTLQQQRVPGFWESLGYHPRGDPWREERHR